MESWASNFLKKDLFLIIFLIFCSLNFKILSLEFCKDVFESFHRDFERLYLVFQKKIVIMEIAVKNKRNLEHSTSKGKKS
jgi:hypothetical protein